MEQEMRTAENLRGVSLGVAADELDASAKTELLQ
jgi:hypothetical protein